MEKPMAEVVIVGYPQAIPSTRYLRLSDGPTEEQPLSSILPRVPHILEERQMPQLCLTRRA